MVSLALVENLVSKLDENERLVLIGKEFNISIYKDFGITDVSKEYLWVTKVEGNMQGCLLVNEKKVNREALSIVQSECTHVIPLDEVVHLKVVKEDDITEKDYEYKETLRRKTRSIKIKKGVTISSKAVNIIEHAESNIARKIDPECNYELDSVHVLAECKAKLFGLDQSNPAYENIRIAEALFINTSNGIESKYLDAKDLYILVNTNTNCYTDITKLSDEEVKNEIIKIARH